MQANVLASCYVVDSQSAMLKGLHYSTTGAGGELIHSRKRKSSH
jgi:hypothetical protein